jgi:hypothetical protein
VDVVLDQSMNGHFHRSIVINSFLRNKKQKFIVYFITDCYMLNRFGEVFVLVNAGITSVFNIPCFVKFNLLLFLSRLIKSYIFFRAHCVKIRERNSWEGISVVRRDLWLVKKQPSRHEFI